MYCRMRTVESNTLCSAIERFRKGCPLEDCQKIGGISFLETESLSGPEAFPPVTPNLGDQTTTVKQNQAFSALRLMNEN
jgi:hypothetical protein